MDQKDPSLKWSGYVCHGQALLKFASVVLFLSPKAVIGLTLIHREQKYNQMWVYYFSSAYSALSYSTKLSNFELFLTAFTLSKSNRYH